MIGLPDLVWLPKKFGPGDMDGTGATKVLGRPEVNLVNLLVRETAQNAWDARLPGVVPRFELRMRSLDDSVRDVLTWNVFTERPAELGLDEVLADRDLTGLEIVDRGTKGLGGPTTATVSRDPDEPSDYADFILTMGAPPDNGHGGGTYGFGKTASYLASECSTILVWSRWRRPDGHIVERFIASAMGATFEMEGERYTGRQWWGDAASHPSSDGVLSVHPAEGEDARRLGEAVFERHFGANETGTSILILQPNLTDSGDDADGEDEATTPEPVSVQLAGAVVRNLWPKIALDQDDEWRMDIAVIDDGLEVPLLQPDASPVLAGLWCCLRAIRAEQRGEPDQSALVTVTPTTRYGKATGHVALTTVVGGVDGDALADLANTVTQMRNEAELVVRCEAFPDRGAGGFRWVGVFKPIHATDPAFAAAEPPAHDSWSNVDGLDKVSKSIVTRSLKGIREGVIAFTTPEPDQTPGSETPTAKLATALAGLAAGIGNDNRKPPPDVGSRSKGRPPKKPKVDVLSVVPLARDPHDRAAGRQRTRLTMSVHAQSQALLRIDGLALAVDGGQMASGSEVVLDRWIGGEPADGGVVVAPREEVSAVISYPEGMAIEFSFSAVGI
ncbi:hypothetical protein [Kribbia dieselivorans]|uniref:hypothetical protein n=1 Tax=Kribbia dieselivorans TaxID=331526 RepID=UPI0008388966|nr:hypothetical protein [Kribbia dieselivorans]